MKWKDIIQEESVVSGGDARVDYLSSDKMELGIF